MRTATIQKNATWTTHVFHCIAAVALMTIGAWVTVPFGPVPFTLQTLAVMFVLFTLDPREALASIAAYLVIGAQGAPVFASFKGGIAALTGPTAGFIVGFLVAGAAALAAEAALAKLTARRDGTDASFFGERIDGGLLARNLIKGVVFMAVLYFFGWAWLMVAAHMTPAAAFAAAVAPFIVIDGLKMVAAVLLSQSADAVAQKLAR